ncbi:hypothetical protein Tco_1257640, partial [Tanacetum coccineum]
MIQSDDVPRQIMWTIEEEITLAKGWLSISENNKDSNAKKKVGFLCDVLEYIESKTKQYGRRTYDAVMAFFVILISSDSSEESVGTSTARVIMFGTIPTIIPPTIPTIDLPIIYDDTPLVPTDTPTIPNIPSIAPTIQYTSPFIDTNAS